MAWNGLLASLHPPVDADYVDHFQRLAGLNLEIKRLGPTQELLLRKSLLEAALGNYEASRRSAQDAAALDPGNGEAQHQFATASLLLAYAEAGAVESRRSPDAEDGPPVRALVSEARDALQAAIDCNPHDSEAQSLLKRVKGLLSGNRSERTMAEALLAERGDGPPSRLRPPRPVRDP